MSKIDLSVAIIFKNEIRCLERCLKSLQPLRERLSVQIVMADTGSTDGSRAIAEQYADILFDFPWINDFAAARNAVLERCSGRWTLVIDCDEWLDEDTKELVDRLVDQEEKELCDGIQLTIRDYMTESFETYMDFAACRLLCMASKPRYEGVIHERICFDRPQHQIDGTIRMILHHDGYVMLNNDSEAGKQKRERNRTLMQKQLEKDPDNLRFLLQYLECSNDTFSDYFPTLHRAMRLVEGKAPWWNWIGPIIFRIAVYDAYKLKLPELEEWAKQAQRLFPNSYFVRVDISFVFFACAFSDDDYAAAIEYGEAYLSGYRSFSSDPRGRMEISLSSLQRCTPYWEQFVRLRLADVYRATGRYAETMALLEQTDWTLLDARHTEYFVSILQALSQSGVNVDSLLSACWAGIQQPVPSPERAQERVEAFRKLVSVEPTQRAQGESDELAQLAAKVKAILDKLPPDDPIAVELKSSDAYRKVAHLIEG